MRPGALWDFCKTHDISRDELARRMGISSGTAYRTDSGKTEPSAQFIARLLTLADRPFEDFFQIVGPV